MDRKLFGILLLCLGLLGVVAVGGAAAATVDAGDVQTQESVVDAEDDGVSIADTLRDADGTVEVIVSLPESDGVSSPAGLQAHASETQQPLVAFAETRRGVTVENRFWLANAALVTVDTTTVSLLDLASVEGVQAIYENREFTVDTGAAASPVLESTAVTANGSYTYGLEQINAPTAWEQHNTTGEGASVAVLDTGVAADHPDLSVAKWQEFDSDGNPIDSEPNDGDGHGTHVSGTVSGAMNPAGDVPSFGVAPNVSLYGGKVLDDSGGGSFAQIIGGMEWAVNESADVISMSLGATGFFDEMIAPVQNAQEAGTTVVSSAGNSGEGSSGSPGNVYDAISVGASNSNGGIAEFSSGEQITTDSAWSEPPAEWPDEYVVPSIAAPGVNTLSSVPGGGYDDTFSGTSMAAPHVSGTVALAESALDKELSPAEIEEALEQTAFKPGDSPAPPGERDTRYGSGIIDANAFIAFLDGLEDEPFLTLSVDGPATAEPEENLTVNYTIENLGGVEGTESQVNLLINGTVEDSATNVTVGPNETVSGSLTFEDLDEYDEGDLVEWTVEMVDWETTASGSTGVGLLPGTDIVIQSLDYADPLAPGQNLSVEYTLENLGAEDGTETFVDLLVDGTDSTWDDTDSDVTVPGGETVNGTLTLDAVEDFFEPGDTISFTVELWDSGDVAAGNTTIEVPDEPAIQLQSVSGPDVVETNETLTVDYTIENAGGAEGTESAVELVINGTVEDSDTNVTVPAGETASGSLTFEDVDEYEEGDIIEWTVELADFGDTASGSTSVGLLPEPDLVIQSLDYSDTVAPDGALDVEYTLENLGAGDGTESFVDLLVNGTDETWDDTDEDVTVPGGGTTTGTLTFDAVGEFFEAGDTISFTVELFSYDDVAAGSATVAVPDEPLLQLQSVDAPSTVTAGEDLAIDYTIENIGSVAGTESAVDLLTNGTVEDTDTNVTVPGEGTANGTLTVENVDGSALPTSIAVEAGDEQVESESSVEIAGSLRDVSGEVEVIVSMPALERASSPEALQAHATESQQPLAAFAEAQQGVTVENRFWLTNAALVTVDTTTVSLSDLAAVEGVRAIYENQEFTVNTGAAAATPALGSAGVTANGSYTYGLEQINAPTAWEQHNTTGEGASVAVLDTGVAADHPDLSVAKWQEFDSDGNPIDSEPNDGQGHGTHVSGTVSGPVDPAGDVPAYGVAPNVSLYGGKVLDDSGGGSFAQIIGGMQWAVNESADVISMSLGATGFSDQMIAPVQNAHDAGTTVVAAAGNSGEGSSGSPGNVYDSIAVGASNSNQGIAEFSSGEEITTDSAWSEPPAEWPDEYVVPTIAAPGVNTLSSVPGGGYDDTFSGTSMATPHVSGVIALAESALDKELSAAEVEQALEATAFKPGDAPAPPGQRDTRYGSGIVDANAFIAFLDGLEDEPFLTLTASGPATVEPNETLSVNYTIENLGGVEGTESTMNLLVNGTVEDSVTNVTVGPNETVSGTFTFEDVDEYEEGDLIDWTVEMVDWETTASGSTGVGLLPGTEIVIQSLDYPGALAPGQDLAVEYTLENLGFEDGTETFVDLLVDGTDTTYDDTDSDVTVPGGETVSGTLTLDNPGEHFDLGETITFSVELWDSGDTATGETGFGEGEVLPWTVGLADTGDSDSGVVLVQEPETANFQIVDATSNAPLAEGETLAVNVTVENVGAVAGTQNVTTHSPGLGTNTTLVELGPGESLSHTMTMDIGTGPDVVGNHTMTVETQNHSTQMSVEVHLPTMPGNEDPPEDVDGDDLYEDVDGDGAFDILDVQTFFNHLGDGMMDEHGWAFDYAGTGTVDIFDVQALYTDLTLTN